MKTIRVDKAGRVVIPKPLREQFHLLPGDKLKLSIEGDGFKITPADTSGKLVKKGSVLVFTGEFSEPITTKSVSRLLDKTRKQ